MSYEKVLSKQIKEIKKTKYPTKKVFGKQTKK